MRFAIASGFGVALSWWARLKDEGHDVRVYIEPSSHRTIGDGLVEKIGAYDDLMRWAKEAPSIVLFDSSGMGEQADAARRAGLVTLCGGSFMDRLEKDRSFGFKIAAQAGCRLPEYAEFPTIGAALAVAPKLDRPVYFKTDRYLGGDATHKCETAEELIEYLEGVREQNGDRIKCILQEKLEGVAVSTARWWNGTSWAGPYEAAYEHKALMNDDVGPSTGCSFNAVFFYDDDPEIAEALHWEELAPIFRKNDAPAGLYDINALIGDDGEAYFLEWTPRLGYDSETTSQRLIPNLGEFLESIAFGKEVPSVYDELAYSIRLAVPPYPSEDVKHGEKSSPHGKVRVGGTDGIWKGHFIAYCVRGREGGLEMASPEGIVGLSLANGSDLSNLHEEAVEFAKNMGRYTPGLMYRTDGADRIAEDAERVLAAGFEIHEGMG